MIRINYIVNTLPKNKRFPDVHQEKHVRKHYRNLVESTRNVKTQHVSQDNMETRRVSAFS